MAKAQTIKQAKAAFKARNHNPLSEREKRQMERSIELDNRAWRNKEQEKRRAEAAAKKRAKEMADRQELMRNALGTQRRRDKFGYRSSQFHLKAFFKTGPPPAARTKSACPIEDADGDDDSFDDDFVDDESLLKALEFPVVATPIVPRSHPLSAQTDATTSSCLKARFPQLEPKPLPAVDEDFSSFLDDLGSSTQIERELQSECRGLASNDICTSSFGSLDSSFDLTVEDMEALEASNRGQRTAEDDRKLMPPPTFFPVTAKIHSPSIQPETKKRSASSDVPERRASFPVDCKQVAASITEFTMTQLETFVDDDLQLTQVNPD